jgi:hypothetical protein
MRYKTACQLRSLLLVAAALLLGGCSHFDREWLAAGDRPPYGIDGRWQGTWLSEGDGHHGPLLCAIHDYGDGHYDAAFNAAYARVFKFSYDAKFSGRPAGELVHLQGETNLGWPIGVYRYDGMVSKTQFYCTYRSKDDHGYFALARPGETPPSGPLTAGK